MLARFGHILANRFTLAIAAGFGVGEYFGYGMIGAASLAGGAQAVSLALAARDIARMRKMLPMFDETFRKWQSAVKGGSRLQATVAAANLARAMQAMNGDSDSGQTPPMPPPQQVQPERSQYLGPQE